MFDCIVLSMPHRVRYLLAYDHARCIAVLRIFVSTLLGFYRKRASQRGDTCKRRSSALTAPHRSPPRPPRLEPPWIVVRLEPFARWIRAAARLVEDAAVQRIAEARDLVHARRIALTRRGVVVARG